VLHPEEFSHREPPVTHHTTKKEKRIMNTVTKGHIVDLSKSYHEVIDADVHTDASRAAGVWLVDGDDASFHMTVGTPTEEAAARAYAAHCKANGRVPPPVFRVFPLRDLEPISRRGIIDDDGDEEWLAFQDAWVEIRL
jgi:hypothetical protein